MHCYACSLKRKCGMKNTEAVLTRILVHVEIFSLCQTHRDCYDFWLHGQFHNLVFTNNDASHNSCNIKGKKFLNHPLVKYMVLPLIGDDW